jgi:hypothetical protein
MQSLPGTGVQLDTLPDQKGASQALMGSLAQNADPMAQQLMGGMIQQMFAPPPESKYVDTGDGLMETVGGRPTGRVIPKGVSPDTMAREGGEDRRLMFRDEGEDRRLGMREAGEDRRLGIREAGDNARNVKAEEMRVGKATASLRKEFESLDSVKRYQKVLPTVVGIANAPDTPAGDLAMVYGAAKVLDPDSAVKEGEFQTVLNAKSPMETVIGGVRFYTTGKGRLTPQSRDEIEQMLESQVRQYKSAYDRDYERYSGYGIDQGVESEKIVGTRFDSAFTDRGVQKIQSDAEYAKLPSGATFIGPDGKKRRKP